MQEGTVTANTRSGIGVGSASIVLIFAVLCLTVFTLITYIVASNNKALVDAEAGLVTGYYRADVLAEMILLEIICADTTPAQILDVEISSVSDTEQGTEIVSFHCPVSESKALYVSAALGDGTYDILSWRMVDTSVWVTDGGINVWGG